MRLVTAAILIAVFFAVMQIFVLPPDGFMTGDQGSKYLQTRAFAEHGPLNPSIDVRSRDIDPAFKHQEPKLKNRRGRLVSEFLWLMPLLGSPFLAAFGLRGLYIMPAVSVIVVLFCAARLARRRDDPNGALTALLVVIVTPMTVYGLELWEHAPAAACVMVMAVLLVPSGGSGRGRFFAAGVVAIAAFLFREEAAVALPALFVGRALTKARVPGVETRAVTAFVTEGFWCGLGVVAGLVVSAPMNLMMYGAVLPMHLTQDAWEYAKSTSYLGARYDIVRQLVMPADYPWAYAAALALGVAASIYALRRPGLRPRRDLPLAVVHAAVIVTLSIAVALPLWRLAFGSTMNDAYTVESAAHGWPFVLALLYLPWLGDEERAPHARYLIISAGFAILFTTLVLPGLAGAQWSPRCYLQIAPLLALPAIESAWVRSVVGGRDPVPGGRASEAGSPGGEALVLWGARAALIASVLMVLTGIDYLSRAKIRFAAVTHGLARLTADGEVVISDVFWVPEVTATLAPTRRFLFSWNPSDLPTLAQAAIGTGLPRFSLVTYAVLTHHTAPYVIDVPGARCRYVRGDHQFGLQIAELVLSRYACADQ